MSYELLDSNQTWSRLEAQVPHNWSDAVGDMPTNGVMGFFLPPWLSIFRNVSNFDDFAFEERRRYIGTPFKKSWVGYVTGCCGKFSVSPRATIIFTLSLWTSTWNDTVLQKCRGRRFMVLLILLGPYRFLSFDESRRAVVRARDGDGWATRCNEPLDGLLPARRWAQWRI